MNIGNVLAETRLSTNQEPTSGWRLFGAVIGRMVRMLVCSFGMRIILQRIGIVIMAPTWYMHEVIYKTSFGTLPYHLVKHK